ncbi:MAG: hypothetical protein U0903_01120 [Planctomycetales bacterium]
MRSAFNSPSGLLSGMAAPPLESPAATTQLNGLASRITAHNFQPQREAWIISLS